MSAINQEKRDLKYNEWARKYPAIISVVFPLLVFAYFYQKYTGDLNTVQYLVGVIISFGAIIPAILFFYQLFIREVSVFLVEKPLFFIFGRPCVNLIYGKWSILSKQRRKRILKKAKETGILIPPKYVSRRIKRILYKEAFESIRETCRENSLIFEYNCVYGFFRNFSGGLIIDLLFCLALSYFNSLNKFVDEQLLSFSAIILGVLLFFGYLFSYTSSVRHSKRIYIIYEQSKG